MSKKNSKITENNTRRLLSFSAGNAKIRTENTYIFSLPAGYSCPGARDCLAKCDIDTGRIKDGPEAKYRCYAASQETRPSVRAARWRNYTALLQVGTVAGMRDLILESLPTKAKVIRIHESGDFFNQKYFDAWMYVAAYRADVLFYAYTKSIPFVNARMGQIPENFKIVWSSGGRFDDLGRETSLSKAEVVFYKETAEASGLPIDHTDEHARAADHDFALLLHGVQPKGTPAADAMRVGRDERAYSNKRTPETSFSV